MFKSKTNKIQRIGSKKLQDSFYEGKMVKLDISIKHIIKNSLVEFPDEVLTIKSFNTFSIDNNRLDVINFDNNKYIGLWDEVENNLWFMQHIMTNKIASNESPITEDVLQLNEDGEQYDYVDDSGLIEVKYFDNSGTFLNDRLIRMYQRTIGEDKEVLLLTMDNPNYVTFYVGYKIEPSQLEDV